MTGRERVNRVFDRHDHDRVSCHDHFWNETIRRWQHEGLRGDANTVIQMLGGDFHAVGGRCPCPFPGRHEIVQSDEQTKNCGRYGVSGRAASRQRRSSQHE